MILRACELEMSYLALTDHVEIERFTDPEYNCDKTVAGAAKIIPPLKDRFSGKIELIYGVELGQPLHDPLLTEKVLNENKYDFVIGSAHTLRGREDFYFLDYSKAENEPYKLLDLYFEELLEMAQWSGFDVMGHITYPLRYIVGDHNIQVDMNRYIPKIKEMFKELIRNDKGIEINSSGLRQKIGKPLPDEELISLYRELGGRILTVGSDAHRTDDLGKGIPECIRLAKKIGFKELAIFKNRKPQFIEI